jgi:hypothetical protein
MYRRDLWDATSYEVRSAVPAFIFADFVDSLRKQSKPTVSKQNADSLSLLAEEFAFADLRAECEAFAQNPLTAHDDRITALERQVLAMQSHLTRLDDVFFCHERELARLSGLIEGIGLPPGPPDHHSNPERHPESDAELDPQSDPHWESESDPEFDFGAPDGAVGEPPSTTEPSPQVRDGLPTLGCLPVGTLPSVQTSQMAFPRIKIERARRGNSMDGLISYLTKRHGGNVHETGILAITSKSVFADNPDLAAKNVADLATDSRFGSDDGPGQWICWDFRDLVVRPTNYGMRGGSVNAWVLEGSMDGTNWKEMDRRADVGDFDGREPAFFEVACPEECRFVRMTQNLPTGAREQIVTLHAVEFFGQLFE